MWSARTPLIVGFVTLVALLGGFGTWSAMTEISGAIIASGRVEVDRNRQVVQHPDGGVVAEILVEEGDYVAAGDLLIDLDDTDLASNLAIVEGELFELRARRGRLEAERDGLEEIVFDKELLARSTRSVDIEELMQGQVRLFESRKTTLAQRIEALERRKSQIANQIEGVVAQQNATRRQLDLIEQELDQKRGLFEKGLAQASQVLNLERAQAQLDGRLGELVAGQAQAEGRITEIDIEILALATERREQAITQLRDLRYRELEAAEQRRALRERLSRLRITAPVSGVVYGLAVSTPRSVIRPAEPLLFLVPQDRPLVIAAQVAPIHRDLVRPGQDVLLRLSAFEQRTTPELNGRVVLVSADTFTDEASAVSYYRAEIELNDGELSKLPEGLALAPGMPVETYLLTSDRTPLAFIVKPLSDYFFAAFRG